MINTVPTKNQGWTLVLPNGRQFLPLIAHQSCDTLSQEMLNTTMRKQTQTSALLQITGGKDEPNINYAWHFPLIFERNSLFFRKIGNSRKILPFIMIYAYVIAEHFCLIILLDNVVKLLPRVTRRVPLVEQELLTLQEQLSSPPVFAWLVMLNI
jgi:hypothetical protein